MDCPIDDIKRLVARAKECREAAKDIAKAVVIAPPKYVKSRDYGSDTQVACPSHSIPENALREFMISQLHDAAGRYERQAQAARFRAMQWLTEQQTAIGREIREYQEDAQ